MSGSGVRKQNSGFDRAVEHHRAGRVEQAEALYRKVVEQSPQHDRALFLLGALCLASQRFEEALSFSRRAAQADAHNAHYLCNWGEALRRLGRLEEAAEVLVQAVSRRPDLPEASFNLALVLSDLGQVEEALTCLVRAADVAPERYEIQLRLAREFKRAGESNAAVAHYQTALALNPRSLEALLESSRELRRLKRSDGAVAMARRAVALVPSSAAARTELGCALANHERASDVAEAISHFREAIRLDAKTVDAHFGLGSALVDSGQLDAGLDEYRTVIELDRQHADAASNIAYLTLFAANTSAERALAAAKSWAAAHAPPRLDGLRERVNDPEPEKRLKVGYLGLFQDHATALFLEQQLVHHDRSAFELYGYAINARQDSVTDRQRARLHALRDVSHLDDAATAQLIRDDGIDVLIDFNLHMANSRLRAVAEKPAPVQIVWLAYPGTTGLESIYRITDGSTDPEGAPHSLYTETLLRLPGRYWCYDPLTDQPAVAPLPALANGYLTFGSLNAFWKTNPGLFALWAKVLGAIPNSRFVLLAPHVAAEQRALEAFARGGIAAERIRFMRPCARADYLAAYASLDIALDTLPYNGHTTTLDALWMGVPVITRVGTTAAGRAGLGVLSLVGLTELIAETDSEFVARAASLSRDLPALSTLRAGLRARLRDSDAMNGARFTTHFEAALRGAWRTWCASRPDRGA